jgi:pimeloyl-ACP methyl ester carboxylesterase
VPDARTYNLCVQTHVAHLPHRSVRYLESGGGRPLVLLHALPLSADMWLPQVHRVPRGWRFIAPDLRGFRGGGFAFDEPGLDALTMDDYAQDVLALMAHLDLDRAAVAGVSMGGYVAFAMLRRAPRRITHLVLSNTRATADSDEARANRDKMIELVRREGPRAIADAMVEKLLGETSRREQPDLIDAVRGLIVVNGADGLAAAFGALKTRPDSRPLLCQIACPTLVVVGDEDAIIPHDESEAMQREIPGSRLAVIARTGHLSSLEDPTAWNREVAAFLG